ncbi:MAG: hypothetical protein MJ228_02615 [Bacilli bacterium]|nr:hypothetical protein [Bacilli bacterium]
MKTKRIWDSIILLGLALTSGCTANIERETDHQSISESSSDTSDALEKQYSEYLTKTNIDFPDHYNDIICCWKIANGEWRCGIFLDKSSDMKLAPFVFMQEEKPCTLETMAAILFHFYDNTDPNLIVSEIPYPVTKDNLPRGFKVSDNRYLYEQLSLRASYAYNIQKEDGSASPILSSAQSEIEDKALTSQEKNDYYSKFGGGCVYTWNTPVSGRMFGILGAGASSYEKVFSFNSLKYIQNPAALNLGETAAFLNAFGEKSDHYFKSFLIEIPYPISESFYYENYLLTYPKDDFFSKDAELLRSIPYAMSGYDYLIEQRVITSK